MGCVSANRMSCISAKGRTETSYNGPEQAFKSSNSTATNATINRERVESFRNSLPSANIQERAKPKQPIVEAFYSVTLQIQLLSNQTRNLTALTSATGEQLKQRIYDQLSQQLTPNYMNIHIKQTKIGNQTKIQDLKAYTDGSRYIIRQSKIDLAEVKGLLVDSSGMDPLTCQVGVAKMSCGHYIGRDGMVMLIRSLISSKKWEIRCPSCSALWGFEVCRKVGVFTQTELNEFDTGLSMNYMNKGMKRCPNPQCNQTVVKLNLETNHVICPCGAPSFCYQCLNPWKGAVGTKQCGNKQSTCPLSAVFTLNGKVYNAPKYRACVTVNCNTVIQYEKNCKHMPCKVCLKSFCWVCLRVPASNGYYPCGGPDQDCGFLAGRQTIKK